MKITEKKFYTKKDIDNLYLECNLFSKNRKTEKEIADFILQKVNSNTNRISNFIKGLLI